MAKQIQVGGAALVQVAASAGVLADLGYTINGVEITENIYKGEVPGDENGGEEGPPIDIQYFGEVHTLRMQFSKFDASVLTTIKAGIAGATEGTPGLSGTLYFQGVKDWKLKIVSTNFTRTYGRVIFSEPKEFNTGTKFTRMMIVATCYKDANGVVWS